MPVHYTSLAIGTAAGAIVAVVAAITALQMSGKKVVPQKGREEACIKYVFKHARQGDPASVLATIDTFCVQQEWMMNLGPEKGHIVRSALVAASGKTSRCKLVLEWGAYCGYSAVLIASTIPADAKLLSIEINPYYAAIATKMVEYAGLAHKVTVHVSDVPAGLQYVRATHGLESVDAVFIDHWKQYYLNDLQTLEGSGLLKQGSVVIADNIICPGAPDYLAYVKGHTERYESHLHMAHLEYSTQEDAVCVSKVIGPLA